MQKHKKEKGSIDDKSDKDIDLVNYFFKRHNYFNLVKKLNLDFLFF